MTTNHSACRLFSAQLQHILCATLKYRFDDNEVEHHSKRLYENLIALTKTNGMDCNVMLNVVKAANSSAPQFEIEL